MHCLQEPGMINEEQELGRPPEPLVIKLFMATAEHHSFTSISRSKITDLCREVRQFKSSLPFKIHAGFK